MVHSADELIYSADILGPDASLRISGVRVGVKDLVGEALEQAQLVGSKASRLIVIRTPDATTLDYSCYIVVDGITYIVDNLNDPRSPRPGMWTEVQCHVEQGGTAAAATGVTPAQTFKAYVDAQDAATLAAAEAYTNSALASDGIAAEVTRAEAAEGIIAAAVVSEASSRTSADSSEANTRATADTTLQTNITAEVTARASADTTEVANRNTAIAVETTRAQAAEALLAPKLTPAFSGVVTMEDDGIGGVAIATVIIKNATPATLSTPQNPGKIQFQGANFDGSSSNLAAIAEIIAGWGAGAATSTNLTFSLIGPANRNAFVVFRNFNPATSGQNVHAPIVSFVGFYWDGTQSQQETWEWVPSMAAGSNPASVLALDHFGTPGGATLDLSSSDGLGTTYKVLVPTRAVDTNTTDAASTAFVIGQAATATPLIAGTAAVGVSTRFARADHVHPASFPKVVAEVHLTGQTTSINATAAYTPAAEGVFLVCMQLYWKVASSGGSVLGAVTFWTPNSVTAIASTNITAASAANLNIEGDIAKFVRCQAGKAINYQTTLTPGSGSPQYDLEVVVIQIA